MRGVLCELDLKLLCPVLPPPSQDLMLRHGWRTGAIVPELETETKMVNTEQYSQALTWLQALTGLLERMQVSKKAEEDPLGSYEWNGGRSMTRNSPQRVVLENCRTVDVSECVTVWLWISAEGVELYCDSTGKEWGKASRS